MADFQDPRKGDEMHNLEAADIMRRDSVRMQLRLWTEGLVDGRLDFHNCSNLSTGGMFIETADPYDVGKAVQIEFNLPGIYDSIKVTGEVVSRIDEAHVGGTRGNGFKFVDLGEADQHLIEKFIETSIEEESIF